MEPHRIVSRDEWLVARKAHLACEKALTKARDELRRQRSELPWVRVEKDYAFDGPQGRASLADLFAGRGQLIVQHFMFGPDWKEGCVGCSFQADHIDAARRHFEHNDLAFAAVSRAPLEKIEAFRERMGWGFSWVSSQGSDFNFDFHVSFHQDDLAKGPVVYNYARRDVGIEELSGLSVFCKDARGQVFHTYSTFARGTEHLLGSYG